LYIVYIMENIFGIMSYCRKYYYITIVYCLYYGKYFWNYVIL